MGKLIRLVVVVAVVVGLFMFATKTDGAGKMMDAGSGGIGKAFDKLNDALGGSGKKDTTAQSDRPYASKNKESLAKVSKNIGEQSQQRGYTRDKFGSGFNKITNKNSIGWDGIENKKCNVRNAVLIEQGSDVAIDNNCRITAGKWKDLYGERDRAGNITYYESSVPKDFDIDHVVALSLAWRSGADQMDADTRNKIANDTANLMLSKASINRAKGDQDVTTWTPPRDANHYCDYMDRYVYVKAKYDLRMTQKEFDVVKGALDTCNAKTK